MSAERACEQLGYAFFRCLDFFDQDALPELFCERGELVDSESFVGRSSIAGAVAGQERRTSRHLVSNVFIEVTGATSARGISYVTEVSANGSIERIGHSEDRFVLEAGEWLFERRRLHWLAPA